MPGFGPIPNFEEQRRHRQDMELRYDFDTENPLYRDPLVDPRSAEYGFFDSSSYYAKPNEMTGDSIPGIPDAPLVRKDIALRLKRADDFLRSDQAVREVLGSNARIRIDDALRPHIVQKFAYEVAWPTIIRLNNPGISEHELQVIRDLYVARPADTPIATPHATGGAVDVILINLKSGLPFDRGYVPGDVNGTAYPDAHESYGRSANYDYVASGKEEVLNARRVLYFAMTSVAGLVPNPLEIWHFGLGDPYSASLTGQRPYYDIAPLPQWYAEEMQQLQNES